MLIVKGEKYNFGFFFKLSYNYLCCNSKLSWQLKIMHNVYKTMYAVFYMCYDRFAVQYYVCFFRSSLGFVFCFNSLFKHKTPIISIVICHTVPWDINLWFVSYPSSYESYFVFISLLIYNITKIAVHKPRDKIDL